MSGWTPDASNPITGADEADDPYIAKTEDGLVYRDASDRALMFTEEKGGETHRGIELWRSDPNTLDNWVLFGRVIDQGAPGTWNEDDSTSPVVIFDGTQLVMLFEGRSPTQRGQIGYATSADDGETWTVAADPIIVQGAGGSWNEQAVVCDDLIKVDSEWVLLGHGAPAGVQPPFQSGRWVTTDAPAVWDNTSFTEMVGNPYDDDPVVTVWSNNPERAVRCAQNTGNGEIDVLGVYEA